VTFKSTVIYTSKDYRVSDRKQVFEMVTKTEIRKRLTEILNKVDGCPSCYAEVYTLLGIIDSRIEYGDSVKVKISYDKPHILITQI
jgi:hypothetical protein